MDNLDKVDDALKKKDGNRAIVLLAIPIVVALWFAFKDAISGRSQAEAKAAVELKVTHERYARQIDSLNTNWTKLYNAQVEARLKDKDEYNKKLEERAGRYEEASFQHYSETKVNRYKTNRNNIKTKVLENVINPAKQ